MTRHLACRLGTTGRFGVRELTVAATRYRIALRGRLSERFGYVFNGMTLEYGPNQTALVGDVRDQSASVRAARLGAGPRDRTARDSTGNGLLIRLFAPSGVRGRGSTDPLSSQATVVNGFGLASSARCAEPTPATGGNLLLRRRRWVMAGAAEVVITTKLFRPSLRHHTVERERLHDMLRLGCTLPLTLVVAPAGWGKSTLVAEW